MKVTKEFCLELGKNYIHNNKKYPVSKNWNISNAGCSRDRIYEIWGSWPSFIEELKILIDIGEYKGSNWRKGLVTSIEIIKDRICINCNKIFNSYNKDQKYCSKDCSYTNSNLGGVRKGSGRSITGYCDGIYCGSTYELAWVIYNLDNNIDFSRCDLVFSYDNKKYYPDFFQNNIIIEIKSYWTEEVEYKKQAVLDAGYSIQILYKKDLEYCFKWIKENYESPLETLFDTYSPKYTYICSYCATAFTSNRKRKTQKVYCSRKCSGHSLLGGPI